MIPTTTGAAKATSLVIPEVKGKIDGIADARPDARRLAHRSHGRGRASNDDRRRERGVPKAAADGPLKGILQYTEEELVSADYIGNPYSCILDSKCTNVIDGTLVKVSGWYDNEWGYASRCVDLLRYIGARL